MDEFPMNSSMYKEFSIAILDNQMERNKMEAKITREIHGHMLNHVDSVAKLFLSESSSGLIRHGWLENVGKWTIEISDVPS